MVEDELQLLLKQYNSHFIFYEKSPGIYSMKDISVVLYNLGDLEGTLQIDYDETSMKIKIVLTRFRGNLGAPSFDENSFFNTLLGDAQYCDYKLTDASHWD